HSNLGHVLAQQGKLDDAVAAYRKAITLRPELAEAHGGLGAVLRSQGKFEESVPYSREAVRLDPHDGTCHGSLGQSLVRLGYFAEALTHLKKGDQLLAPTDPNRPLLMEMLKLTEPLAILDAKLPAILDGKTQPANAAERIQYARLCKIKQLNR